jgi:hypothetical protein
MNLRTKKWLWVACLFLFLFLLSAASFWNILSDPDQVMAFNDSNIEFALSPNYTFPACIVRAWDTQYFFGSGSGPGVLSFTALGESIGPVFWRSGGQAILLALCGLAIYWTMRQYGFSRPAAALTAAIGASVGWSHNFAVTGLAVRPVALTCTALALGFVERGRQTRGWLAYAIAGGCLGLGISEIPDVGAILAIASAFVFWWTHMVGMGGRACCAPRTATRRPSQTCDPAATENRGEVTPAPENEGEKVPGLRGTACILWSTLPRFALYVAFSGLLAWQMISVMFATQIQGVTQGVGESPEARYAWATQWSIPPAESWNMVAGNYFGSSMRSETSPYWGRLGRTEGWERTQQGVRNFSMTGWHLGVVPCILLIGLFVFTLRGGARTEIRGEIANTRTGRARSPLRAAMSGGQGTGLPTEDPRQDMIVSNEAAGGVANTTAVQERLTAYPFAHPKLFTLMIFLGCAFSMMLMWGKYFPLYRFFWLLPYINTIRNPEKWNGPFTLFAVLGIAFMLDILFRNLADKKTASGSWLTADNNEEPSTINRAFSSSLLWSAIGMAALSLLILLGTAANQSSFINKLTQEGYGTGSALAYENAIGACIKVLIISGLFAGLIALFVRHQTSDRKPQAQKTKRQKPVPLTSPRSPVPSSHFPPSAYLLPLTALLTLGDLFLDNLPYVAGHKYKQSLAPNPLTDFLDSHITGGRLKLMPPHHPLLNNLRMTQLMVKGYDLFDPVSIARMPVDYDALFKSLEKQPSRLWELGSMKYFLTLPGATAELNKMDGNRGRFIERLALGVGVVNNGYVPVLSAPANQRYLRVVEFTGALPKYRLVTNITTVADNPSGFETALQQLASPDFNPASQAILHTAPINHLPSPIPHPPTPPSSVTILHETPVEVRLRVTTDQPSILVRSTKYDPDWIAILDNQPLPLLRANYLFQAVQVPAGSHEIELSYRPSLKTLKVSVSARIALILLLVIWGLKEKFWGAKHMEPA